MFFLRIVGTSEYVTAIDPYDEKCDPPGTIETGRLNRALTFLSRSQAESAAELVMYIEGIHVDIVYMEADPWGNHG